MPRFSCEIRINIQNLQAMLDRNRARWEGSGQAWRGTEWCDMWLDKMKLKFIRWWNTGKMEVLPPTQNTTGATFLGTGLLTRKIKKRERNRMSNAVCLLLGCWGFNCSGWMVYIHIYSYGCQCGSYYGHGPDLAIRIQFHKSLYICVYTCTFWKCTTWHYKTVLFIIGGPLPPFSFILRHYQYLVKKAEPHLIWIDFNGAWLCFRNRLGSLMSLSHL